MKQPIPIFEGDIVDGKLKLLKHVKAEIARWCLTFKTGSHVEITIRKYHSKVSDLQRGYYFGVVVPILADHFGYDKEDMHSELKLKFNPVESKINPGVIIGGSTTKMDTVTFFSGETSYVERVCRWAASEYSLYIPPPNKACRGEA